jgi:single-stranded-DNA-specific exonuclease
VIIEAGGHHASGGFSVKAEHIFTFGERLNEAYQMLGAAAAISVAVNIDAELTLNEVNELLVRQLDQLAPYGAANPKPLFAFKVVTPATVELFGKAKEHSKLTFGTEHGRLEAIAFFKEPAHFTSEPKPDVPCTLIAHVEQSFFMGRQQIRLRLVDVV